MELSKEYSVGIAEIDDHHQLLMKGFIDIEESMNSSQSWSTTHYAVVKLTQLARMHFSVEESMMRLFGYPDIEEHRIEHQFFFDQLENIENLLLRKSTEIELVQSLKNWLKKHILDSDRVYVEHILSGAQVVRAAA